MVYALDISDPSINPVARFNSFGTILNIIIPNLIIIASIITFIMIIIAGFIFMNSEGKPENIKKAQQFLMYTVVGFSIILASFLATKLIGSIFKISIPF